MRYEDKLYALPPHMREGMKNYIDFGIEPGTFLRLMLEHRIYEAASHADELNKNCLFDYINFMYNYIPSRAHGAPEFVQEWIKQGGSNGSQDHN